MLSDNLQHGYHPTGKLTFDFEPGTKFGYSGEGYQYVRMGTALKINVDQGRLMDSIIEHGGSDMGVKVGMIFLPNSKKGVVVLTNGDNGGRIIRAVYKEALNIGKDIIKTMSATTKLPKIVPVPTDVLKQYLGTYLQARGSEMEVQLDDNVLNISNSGWPIIELFSYAKDKFFATKYPVELVFERDASGKVIKARIYDIGKLVFEMNKK